MFLLAMDILMVSGIVLPGDFKQPVDLIRIAHGFVDCK